MPTIYEDDLKEALIEANKRFDAKEPGGFIQQFKAGEVTILNNNVGNRWDYGAPAIWVASYSVIDTATRSWHERHPNSGRVLPPQEKPHLGWQVNFQFGTTSREFNYHVSVPAPQQKAQ